MKSEGNARRYDIGIAEEVRASKGTKARPTVLALFDNSIERSPTEPLCPPNRVVPTPGRGLSVGFAVRGW